MTDDYLGYPSPHEKLTKREREGAAAAGETCQQRNMRMGWGCKCHGETFCPDEVCIGYENDVPIYVRRDAVLELTPRDAGVETGRKG